ncbi:methyltransferase domain-containing protein [Paraburkholderia sp. NMBU_R16]|uniref:class I SAM-dependent methyltransferase n=1 Tax=Paraburkholderia sp. NMBU_R16 TaxID=2698676 RepID=UPI0015647DF7|nr:class I SAM-dependent methyltransferase [Paraburkholderia sp. NMBU_R16]NRO95886.1 methyltransferase domain-containing protein [Paraburkholderia sp. NMBU_R16]
MLSDDFYRALEDRFRGSRETIKARQSVYLPVVEALHAKVGKKALDVGCGRGEWLELLKERGVQAEGIDLNEEFVDAGRAAGLAVQQADAMQFLASQPDATYELVSAFHVVEHLGFNNLLAFLKEAYRVVDDGGAILLETPNPANLVVGACNFYIDPTHERPIPSVLLSFAAEYSGFESVVVVPVNRAFIHNDLELMPSRLAGAAVINKVVSALDTNLMQAPDYAVVAFKKRDPRLTEIAESLVSGSSLATSTAEEEIVGSLNLTVIEAQREVGKWQERAYQAEILVRDLELKASDAKLHAEEEMRRIEQRAAAAEMEVARLHEHINAIYRSRSWRLAAPIRAGGNALRKAGISRAGLLRIAKPVLMRAADYLRAHPALRAKVSGVLARYPGVRARLVGMLGLAVIHGAPPATNEIETVDRLTARGRKIRDDLLNAKSNNAR